jgi:hypothetical protein
MLSGLARAAKAQAFLTLTCIAARHGAGAAQPVLHQRHRGEKPSSLSRTGTGDARRRLAMEQVARMKHPSTRAVYAYWEERRGTRPAPERADIDPAAIRAALGDTIMLAADFVGQLRFRLAGTRVCALFAREIKGEVFAALWSEQSRPLIEALLAVIGNENVGAVAGLAGRTADGDQVDLELLLLPLAHSGYARIRALGVLAPTVPPYWLGEKPLTEITLGTVRHVGAGVEAGGGRRFVVANGGRRVRHGFTVYSGGQAGPPGERSG